DGCTDVLILSGDQIYRMDFGKLLKTHRDSKADVTITVLPVAADAASGLGMIRLDDSGRVTGFVEKPQSASELEPLWMSDKWIEQRGIASAGRHYMASMGIYIFQRDVLFQLLNTPPLAKDFGREVFP